MAQMIAEVGLTEEAAVAAPKASPLDQRARENAEDIALFREFIVGMRSTTPDGKRQAREAYTKIYLRYRDRVYAYCLRMLNSDADAQDLYQEVFMRVLTRAASFEEEKSLGGWIFTIAHNLCLNKLRDRKPQDTLDDLADSGQQRYHAPLVVQPNAELGESWRDRIEWAMAQLPPDQREALVLREYQGMSHQEIVDVLHTSIPAVKSRIYRAKERLRELLGPYYNENI